MDNSSSSVNFSSSVIESQENSSESTDIERVLERYALLICIVIYITKSRSITCIAFTRI